VYRQIEDVKLKIQISYAYTHMEVEESFKDRINKH